MACSTPKIDALRCLSLAGTNGRFSRSSQINRYPHSYAALLPHAICTVNCWTKSVGTLACNGGPLLDRIDIHIEVPAVPFNELTNGPPGTSSAQIREQVEQARSIQSQRFENSRTNTNAQMSSRELRQHCVLGKVEIELMRTAVTEMGLSARAHDKILRVARTIADLEASENIQAHHVQEAINYRMLDRDIFS